MKRMVLLSLLLTLTYAVGCDSGTTTSNGESSSTSSAADTSSSTSEAADEAAGDSTEPATDDDSASAAEDDAATATTAPQVGDAANTFAADRDEQAVGDAVDTAITDEDSEAAAKTQIDFEQELMAAVREQDMAKALQVVNEALASFPDDMGMQVNRLLLRIRLDADQESQDPDAAAAQFIETAALARDLMQHADQLPRQGQQVIPYAFFNEARGYARQGNVTEALAALCAAVEGGMDHLDFAEDDFFAPVRDNAQFQQGLDELKVVVRERMHAEAEAEIANATSYPFDFELLDLENNPVKLADFKGKVVIVDIWGTWCPPCRQEIPHFIKLKDNYADDLAIVGVNYEDGEGEEVVERIKQFKTEFGMNYPCVIGDQATQDQVPNLQGFPTTLFLDREGKVRLTVVGYHPYEKLEAYVDVLMAEGPSEASETSDAAAEDQGTSGSASRPESRVGPSGRSWPTAGEGQCVRLRSAPSTLNRRGCVGLIVLPSADFVDRHRRRSIVLQNVFS